MSDIIRAIIVMSISGGALAVLLFILKPLVRNRLPKSAQYYMWLVAIAALLIPVSRLVTLPSANVNSPLAASPVGVVDRYVVTTSEESERIAADPATLGQSRNNNDNVQEAGQGASSIASAVDIFMTLYPFGAAMALLYFIISYYVFINLHRRRNKEATAQETALLAELCGRRHAPRLYRNPLVATPMLVGVFCPTIFLPDRDYTDEQLSAVISHELAHYKRKDIVVKWLSVFACAVHWFNPVVWLVRREIDRACELACDEAVIRNLGNMGKQTYGDTLLYVASNTKMPHAVLSTTMCEEKKALKERLGAIMKSKKHTRLAVVVSAVLIVSAVLAACAIGAGRADPSMDEDDAPLLYRELTLDEVRMLAARGGTLQYTDLPNLRPSLLSSTMGGYNPTLYGVEGGYRLLINFNDTLDPASGVKSTALESIWESGGSGIDIRYNDVDEFIRTHPSHPADAESPSEPISDFAAQLIQNTYTSDGDIISDSTEVVVTLRDGDILTKTYDGWYFQNSYILEADLTDDGTDEIIVVLKIGGSTYDAADIHVLSVENGVLAEILTIMDSTGSYPERESAYADSLFAIPLTVSDADGIPAKELEHYYNICTGAEIVQTSGGNGLWVRHLVKWYDVVPFSVILWDGTEWFVAEQGERPL